MFFMLLALADFSPICAPLFVFWTQREMGGQERALPAGTRSAKLHPGTADDEDHDDSCNACREKGTYQTPAFMPILMS